MDELNPTPAAVVADHVSLRYDGQTVLNDVSLRIPAGAVVGIVGRNGAGKSTLLRCLLGLSAPDSGRCSLLGAPSMTLPDEVRARLGYVAQTPDLFDWLTGADHMQRLGKLYPGWSDERARRLAIRLELPLGVRARQLSPGDQQKLSVVLAMGHDPDLLILDEPVASLDPLSRREFMAALFERREEQQAPRTVLVSSHLLADLQRIVSHVVFLRQGTIQWFDEWDAMAEHGALLMLPPGTTEPQGPGVLHRRIADGKVRLVIDRRSVAWNADELQPLNLDDLFAEINA